MTRRLLPYALAALVLVAGFASLHQYNVTWDEGLGEPSNPRDRACEFDDPAIIDVVEHGLSAV